jgi:ribonuclease BN (tRNA processing enzyme)
MQPSKRSITRPDYPDDQRSPGPGGTVRAVEITFVGSGDAFGSGGRFQTCIRLRADGATALVDCGATSLTAMRSQGVDPGEVGTVVLTHLHGDHFGGLPFLVLDGQFTRRTAPLTVLGPAGTRDRLHAAMETSYPGSTRVRRRFEVEVVELDGAGGAHRAGPLTVRSWEVDHASGAPALAVRVDAGGSGFGYSGDTAWTPAVARAADGVDVFACEAYTWDEPVRYHLSYGTLREHEDELAAGRLVLTHMGPKMLGRLRDAEHPAAVDGLVLDTGML